MTNTDKIINTCITINMLVSSLIVDQMPPSLKTLPMPLSAKETCFLKNSNRVHPFINLSIISILPIAILNNITPITKTVAITVAMRTELKIDIAICFMFTLPPLLSQQTIYHT